MNNTQVVLVALEEYGTDSIYGDLDGPVADAVEFANWFRSKGVPGENITLFARPLPDNATKISDSKLEYIHATPGNLYRGLTERVPKLKGELLFVIWCGHGLASKSAAIERFLALPDGPFHFSFDSIASFYCRSDSLGYRFEKQVFLIDACAQDLENFQLPSPISFPTEDFIQLDSGFRRDQFIMFACRAGQKAKEKGGRGIFSSCVLNKMQIADAWPVDMKSIHSAVEDELKQSRPGRDQIPVYRWYCKSGQNIEEHDDRGAGTDEAESALKIEHRLTFVPDGLGYNRERGFEITRANIEIVITNLGKETARDLEAELIETDSFSLRDIRNETLKKSDGRNYSRSIDSGKSILSFRGGANDRIAHGVRLGFAVLTIDNPSARRNQNIEVGYRIRAEKFAESTGSHIISINDVVQEAIAYLSKQKHV